MNRYPIGLLAKLRGVAFGTTQMATQEQSLEKGQY
jgi:hypothetical protein